MEITELKTLPPGTMFRRATGRYRYIVSSLPEVQNRYGRPSRFCYNLDGGSDGYWMNTSLPVYIVKPLTYGVENLPHIPETLDPNTEPPEVCYMLYVEGSSGGPTVRHSLSTAHKEAERLATATRKSVFILRAIGQVDFIPPTKGVTKWRIY